MENQGFEKWGGGANSMEINGKCSGLKKPRDQSLFFWSRPKINQWKNQKISMEAPPEFNGNLGVLYFSSFARVAPVKMNELLRILVAGIWPASKTSAGVAF